MGSVVSIDRESGRVMVLPADGDALTAPMVREGGVWRRGVILAPDLRENFSRASDKEAETLLQEARKEFMSNPSRFKTLKGGLNGNN